MILPDNMAGQPPPMGMPPPDPRMGQIAAAIDLLRKDKLRGFRIDIETDSTIAGDAQQDKQATVEFMTAMGGFLQQAIAAGQTYPPVVPVLGKAMQWAMRRFRVGRDLEAAFDEFVDGAQRQIAQGGGGQAPDPAAAAAAEKSKAEIIKAQIDLAAAQRQDQHDAEMKQLEAQIAVIKANAEMVKSQRDEEHAAAEHQRRMEEITMQAEVSREQAAAKKAAAKAGPAV